MDTDWNVASLTWNPASNQNNGTSVTVPSGAVRTLTIHQGLTNASAASLTLYPNLVLTNFQVWEDNNVDLQGNLGIFVSGSISGSGGIDKTGIGRLTIASTGNTYSGGTRVTNSLLQIGGTGSLGTGSVKLDSATLRLNSPNGSAATLDNAFTIESGGAVLQVERGSLALTGNIGGNGALSFVQSTGSATPPVGRFTLAGNSTYAGGTTLYAVTVSATGSGRALGNGNVNLSTGSVLGLSSANNLAPGVKVSLLPQTVVVLNDANLDPQTIIASTSTTGGTLALGVSSYSAPLNMAQIGNGLLYLGSGGYAVYSAPSLGAGSDNVYRLGAGSRNLTLSPVLIISGHDNVLTGARSVIINDSYVDASDVTAFGEVRLGNANNYTGGTIIRNGRLQIGDPLALGSGPITWEKGFISSTAVGLTLANPITFAAGYSTGGFLMGEPLTLSGPIDLGGSTRTIQGTASKTTITGQISNGGLKLSGGVWRIEGNQPFAGGFTAINATVEVNQSSNLGAPGTALAFDGAKLVPLNPLNVDRPIAVGFSGLVIDTSSFPVTLTGDVSNLSGSVTGQLFKLGTGTLTINSGSFALTRFDIKEGTASVNNNTGATAAYVDDGGVLSGTGSIGYTELMSGGHFSPGNAGPGTFTLHSTLKLYGSSFLDFDLGIASSDKIVFTHGMPSSMASLGQQVIVNISDAGGLAEDQRYTLMDWSAGGLGELSASIFELGTSPIGGHFEVVGPTLQFVTVPEPSIAMLMSCGLVGLSVRRPGRGRPSRNI